MSLNVTGVLDGGRYSLSSPFHHQVESAHPRSPRSAAQAPQRRWKIGWGLLRSLGYPSLRFIHSSEDHRLSETNPERAFGFPPVSDFGYRPLRMCLHQRCTHPTCKFPPYVNNLHPLYPRRYATHPRSPHLVWGTLWLFQLDGRATSKRRPLRGYHKSKVRSVPHHFSASSK